MIQRYLIILFQRYLIILFLMAAASAGSARAQGSQEQSAPEAATHTVAAGESLYVIARRYGMTVGELKALNELTGDLIHPGQVLLLDGPAGPEEGGAPGTAAAPHVDGAEDDVSDPEEIDQELLAELAPAGVSTYVAQPGDTFYSIAAARGTKAYVLMALNGGRRAPLEPGTPVVVPATGRAAAYKVRAGDTLSQIAGREGTTVAALRQANGLTSDLLRVGQTLIIPGAGGVTTAEPDDSTWFAVGRVTIASDVDSDWQMAGGERYDPMAFTVGHRFLPLGTLLIIENPSTGRASFARVADRGPADTERLCEVTPAVAGEIGVEPGALVRIRLVE